MKKRACLLVFLIALASRFQAQVAFVPDKAPGIRLSWTRLPVLDGKIVSPQIFDIHPCFNYRITLNTSMPLLLLPAWYEPGDLLMARAIVHVYGKTDVVYPVDYDPYASQEAESYQRVRAEMTNPVPEADELDGHGLKGIGAAAYIGIQVIKALSHPNWGGGNTGSPPPK